MLSRHEDQSESSAVLMRRGVRSDSLLQARLEETSVKNTKGLWRAYDAFFSTAVSWSMTDQTSVISVDYLCRRIAELQKTQFTFRLGEERSYLKFLAPDENSADVCVVEAAIFHEGDTPCEQYCYTNSDLVSGLHTLKQRANNVTWIHIKDLRAISAIAEQFELNRCAASLFSDMRCHSSISAFQDGIFVSICFIRMVSYSAKLFKVYYYSKGNAVITFERELCSEESSEDDDVRRKSVAALVSSICATDEETLRKISKIMLNLKNLSLASGVCTDVLARLRASSNDVSSVSVLYLLYEIGMQCLFASEGFVELVSRSATYEKTQVHQRRMTTRACLNIYRDLDVLLVALRLSKRLCDEIDLAIAAMLNKSSAEFEAFRKEHMTTSEQNLYISELADSFHHRSLVVEEQLFSVEYVHNSLTKVVEMGTQRDNRNLSLVATIFLPLSFLAGVFGMNFYPGGDSSILLLNTEKGPLWFGVICIGKRSFIF